VPIDSEAPPTELIVEVLMTGRPMPKNLVVQVDDCTLTEEEISGAWRKILPLLGCRLGRDVMEVRLRSDVSVASPTDARNLGVAVGSVELR
jgi:hypothetical protein